ncbi:phage portal protein [Paraburkholderia phenoliruptrix]|uniref:phage portal protein n=1 Tax=Paraburkholderia phenoliruptrix TaxID=252970 RepID=UPI001C4EB481|nr:phage portal protein [Paraburkholderia phenoliruptrix]MBW0450851.1 phage portal protein [Paraburkholderia phenoliruptrix]MBW9100944.1 phage portal protein [Paraburkholderia phenoliruptrix]
MSLFDFFRRGYQPEAQTRPLPEPPVPRAELPTGGETFTGLDDPRLLEYIRRGELDGRDPRAAHALRNMAVLRCVTLISESIGMLPLNLQSSDEKKQVQVDNPAHRLLKYKPNDWQTPIEFKSLMQLRALLDGQSFARVIWSGNRPIRLIPMDRGSTKPRLTAAWQIVYDYTTPAGELITLPAREVFHLRDLSLDGVNGISRVKLSCEALELAEHAERAASRTFRTGVMAGGAIEIPKELSDNAYRRMKQSIADNHAGADNAGSWMLIEEGGTAKQFTATAVSAQQIETRNHQIEEVARMYGVPRPLLMMDDTSWGSGIEQLAIFFIQYGLAHWFVSWEQAAARSFIPDSQLGKQRFKFNEGALLRGTLNDQASFFSKALGAGGQAPWMSQNEVRELADLPKSDDPQTDALRNPMTQKPKRTGDEPAQPA